MEVVKLKPMDLLTSVVLVLLIELMPQSVTVQPDISLIQLNVTHVT